MKGLFSAWDGMGAKFAPTGTDNGHPGLADESTWERMDRLGAEALAGPAGGNPAGSSLAGSSLAGGGLNAKPVSGGIPPAGGGLAGDGLAGRGPAGSGTSVGQAARSALMNSLGLPTGDLRDVLMGSSFFYSKPLDENGEPEGPGWFGQWSAWGETAATQFSGADGKLSLDGEVATAILGVDSRWERWLAGVTLSQSQGEGAYTHPEAAGGGVSSTLTSLNPYVHYRLNERTSLWGVVGYGVGGLTLTAEGAEAGIETDLATTMAAFGGRGVLSVRSGRAGAFELAIVSDALMTNTVSDLVENLMGAAGHTSRLRVMLEGSGSMPLGHRIRGMGVPRFDRLHTVGGRARVVDEARFGLGRGAERRAVAVVESARERSGPRCADERRAAVPGGVGLRVVGPAQGRHALGAVRGRRGDRRRRTGAAHGREAHVRRQRRDGF